MGWNHPSEKLPPPSLLNCPLSETLVQRNIGWPHHAKFCNMFFAVLSQDPSDLQSRVLYHFFSEPGQTKNQRPRKLFERIFQIFLHREQIFQQFHENDPANELPQFTLQHLWGIWRRHGRLHSPCEWAPQAFHDDPKIELRVKLGKAACRRKGQGRTGGSRKGEAN